MSRPQRQRAQKRRRPSASLKALLVYGVLAALFACDAKPPPVPKEFVRHATLQQLTGDVKVKRRDGEEWVRATEQMELTQDDKVRTLGGATATIEFDEGSTIALSEDSLVLISDLSGEKAQRAGVLLLEGRLDAEVDRTRSADFTVRTPAAAARATREIVFQ